jgi:hypothetical protein
VTITVNPATGRFTADPSTIERLKALVAEDAAMLARHQRRDDLRPTGRT